MRRNAKLFLWSMVGIFVAAFVMTAGAQSQQAAGGHSANLGSSRMSSMTRK